MEYGVVSSVVSTVLEEGTLVTTSVESVTSVTRDIEGRNVIKVRKRDSIIFVTMVIAFLFFKKLFHKNASGFSKKVQHC